MEEAIDLGLNEKPDLVVITGDFITWKLEDSGTYSRILKKLSDTVPTFACSGNHDGGRWAVSSHGYKDISKLQTLLTSSNVPLLQNESVSTVVNGQGLNIVGLGDLWARECKPGTVLDKTKKASNPTIVLSHNPDTKELLAPYQWDLLCCGHTHGGQLVIPIIGFRPFLPVRDKRFAEGVLTWGDRHIHITRGVGNLHGMRFNCRPEVSILHLS